MGPEISIFNLLVQRYESRFELENHIKAMHSSDGKPVEYKCEDCGKVLIGRSNFKFKISLVNGIQVTVLKFHSESLGIQYSFESQLTPSKDLVYLVR